MERPERKRLLAMVGLGAVCLVLGLVGLVVVVLVPWTLFFGSGYGRPHGGGQVLQCVIGFGQGCCLLALGGGGLAALWQHRRGRRRPRGVLSGRRPE